MIVDKIIIVQTPFIQIILFRITLHIGHNQLKRIFVINEYKLNNYQILY